MATLYKRATPSQRIMLRIVSGAVLNAAHHHPGQEINARFARSVAKRAVGTLTARWPDVLAARCGASSDGRLSQPCLGGVQRGGLLVRTSRKGSGDSGTRRSPYRKMWTEIAAQLYYIKRSGNTDRYNDFVDILKMIDAIEKSAKEGLS